MHPSLKELAAAYGVDTEYWDWKGHHVEVAETTVISVLAAMDVDASTPDSVARELAEVANRHWRRTLPAVVTTEQGQAKVFDVHVPSGTSVTVSLRLESGEEWQLQQVDNWEPDRWVGEVFLGEASFLIPDNLPLGYHRILAKLADGRQLESTLIVSPHFLGFPPQMGDRRIWGYATQLYSIRSQESWGIGDFSDLEDLATWSATQQYADFLLVNPLHAGEPKPPLEPSPYLPMSRRYVNPIYIRPEAIAEYATLSEPSRKTVAEILAELQRTLADQPLIQRNPVWEAKMRALRIIYRSGRTEARQMAFEKFCRTEGRGLTLFATWCVLVSVYGMDWLSWPEPMQRPSSPEVAAFTEHHQNEIDFFMWLQWCADDQLHCAQTTARNSGMRIGMLNDLAVGVSHFSAEAWALGETFAAGCSVGAPPDHFNQTGQDWGQLPWRPDRLEDLAYVPVRDMIAGVLRHSGGIRVDHIMGLFRLWWIPRGELPTAGTYVRYNHEAMVGILALEAHRAGALVVGEDLGVVEPWVREYLRDRGILGTSVAWFEKDDAGQPLPPEAWREYCLASVTTHDLPPTVGYLAGDHLQLQSSLDLLTEPLDVEMELLRREQQAWIDILHRYGFLGEAVHSAEQLQEVAKQLATEIGKPASATDQPDPEPQDCVEEMVLAMHRFLTATPARVLCATLTDAVGDRRTQNQPGTINEYPNWRVPLCGPHGEVIRLRDLYRNDRSMRLARVMNQWTR